MKKFFRLIASLSALAIANDAARLHAFSLNVWPFSEAYPFQGNVLAQSDLLRLTLGMTRAQVQQLLGESVLAVPISKNTVHYVECFESRAWSSNEYYFTLRQVLLTFNSEDQLEEVIWRDFDRDKEVFFHRLGGKDLKDEKIIDQKNDPVEAAAEETMEEDLDSILEKE